MVITDKEVQNSVARASSHRLDNLVRNWWDAQVANDNGIEGLEIMDKSEGTVLLLDAEPVGAVGGIGALVHTCGDLLLEQLCYLIEKAWGYREIFMHPRDVLDNRNSDRGEILISEPTLLCFHPC
jgi:hypothetical protein